MIYTSYFAKLRKIPKDITPICIARKLPPKVNMLCFPDLYPTAQMLYEYKNKSREVYSEEDYIADYYNHVLSKLYPPKLISDLSELANTEDIVLVCYEKTGDFCHRNLVSQWLNSDGIECKEWVER